MYGEDDNNHHHHDTTAATTAQQQQPTSQRDRNRMAATRCRAKTRAAIQRLEEDERALEERNNLLTAEVAALREHLLLHHNCNCVAIRQYLRNVARIIAQTGGRSVYWGDAAAEEWAAAPCDGESGGDESVH